MVFVVTQNSQIPLQKYCRSLKIEIKTEANENITFKMLKALELGHLTLWWGKELSHSVIAWLNGLLEFTRQNHTDDAHIYLLWFAHVPMAIDHKISIKNCHCCEKGFDFIFLLIMKIEYPLNTCLPLFLWHNHNWLIFFSTLIQIILEAHIERLIHIIKSLVRFF